MSPAETPAQLCYTHGSFLLTLYSRKPAEIVDSAAWLSPLGQDHILPTLKQKKRLHFFESLLVNAQVAQVRNMTIGIIA